MEVVFHIGYHKTGTTWLQRVYFKNHPDIIFLSNSDQPWEDCFLSYLIGTSDRRFDVAECKRRLYAQLDKIDPQNDKSIAMFSAERLSGHPFSGGYDSFRLAERLYQVAPQSRILCVYRDQVKMLRSVYKQLVAEGYLGKVEDLFECKNWRSASFDLGFYEYDCLARKYLELFGEHNLGMIPYECMREDLHQFLTILSDWIGVSFMPPGKRVKEVHRSTKDKVIPFARFLNHFRKTEMNPYPLMTLPDKFRRSLIKIRGVFPGDEQLFSESTCDVIRQRFVDPNKRLNQLVKPLMEHRTFKK